MTYEALIRFAPETSAARLNDKRRGGRTLYDIGELRFLPSKTTIPLLVDHRDDEEIGRVTALMRLQDLDGFWLCAVAELQKPPSWLRRGTRASFQYRELQHDSFGRDICRAGLVSEVSVLSPGVLPAEPLAQVLYVKPIEVAKRSSAAGDATSRHLAAGEYHLRPGETWIPSNGKPITRPGGEVIGLR